MLNKSKWHRFLSKLVICSLLIVGASTFSKFNLTTFANTVSEASTDDLKLILENLIKCAAEKVTDSNNQGKPIKVSSETVWKNVVIKLSVEDTNKATV